MTSDLAALVAAGDVDGIRAILHVHRELVNSSKDLDRNLRPSDAAGMTMLHVAVAEDQPDSLQELLKHGADPNVRNANGRLPLHDCFELGRDEMAHLLVAWGAEVDVCAAAAFGLDGRLQEILERDPAAADDLQTGLTPLGWAVYGNHLESVRMLLRHGATIDGPPFDRKAWEPVSHVANVELARILLEHGANPNCQDEHGNTPLHAAIISRIVADPTEFVELLLSAGADPGILNRAGRTALEDAEAQANREAETYFPASPIGPKRLEGVIELLRGGHARNT